MSDARVDPALSFQLTEATHALYRAALALESVRSPLGVPGGVRCPYLVEHRGWEQDDDPGGPHAAPVTLDDVLGEMAVASSSLEQIEVPDLGPAGVLTVEDLTIGTVDPRAVAVHPARSDEFLQKLGTHLEAVVIHGAFEAGLVLHGALQRTADPRAVEQIKEAIAILDETIRRTRVLVFDLGEARR